MRVSARLCAFEGARVCWGFGLVEGGWGQGHSEGACPLRALPGGRKGEGGSEGGLSSGALLDWISGK